MVIRLVELLQDLAVFEGCIIVKVLKAPAYILSPSELLIAKKAIPNNLTPFLSVVVIEESFVF